MLAIIGVCSLNGGDGDYGAVIFHDQVLNECIDCSHLGVHGRGRDEGLLLAAVIEGSGCADEAYAVSGLALTVEAY